MSLLLSDDVVDAAWDNGLGVHALIWVSATPCAASSM